MILWIDYETTGLDPNTGYMLEVAAFLTDDNLEVVDSLTRVFSFNDEMTRLHLDPYVQDMHTSNGLWEECRLSRNSVRDADGDIVQMLRDNRVESGVCILGGSTINFDRAWMERHMPLLFSWLHYRNLDVSSIKQAAIRWSSEVIPEDLVGTPSIHRASADIMGTIALARFFKDAIFTKGSTGE